MKCILDPIVTLCMRRSTLNSDSHGEHTTENITFNDRTRGEVNNYLPWQRPAICNKSSTEPKAQGEHADIVEDLASYHTEGSNGAHVTTTMAHCENV